MHVEIKLYIYTLAHVYTAACMNILEWLCIQISGQLQANYILISAFTCVNHSPHLVDPITCRDSHLALKYMYRAIGPQLKLTDARMHGTTHAHEHLPEYWMKLYLATARQELEAYKHLVCNIKE